MTFYFSRKVLGNRKIIAKDDSYKDSLESDFEAADTIWAEQNNDPMPAEQLFGFLNAIHKNPYSIGMTMSAEEAREFVKETGGL